MLMSIKEYAAARNISVQAAYKKLHKHEKEIQGHIRKNKGKWYIDAYAQKILDGVFDYQEEETNSFRLQEYERKIAELEKSNEILKENARNALNGMQKLVEENIKLKRENERLQLQAVKKPKFEFFGKR